MKLEDYIETIDYLVSKMNQFYQDDMKQDLLVFLYGIFKKIESQLINPNNIRNYVYICLKNEAIKLNREYTKNKMLSLNTKLDNKTEMLDLIVKEKAIDYSKIYNEIIQVAKANLTHKEYEAFYMHFILGKTQTSISKSLNISLQCLNNRIQTAIKKIKICFEC